MRRLRRLRAARILNTLCDAVMGSANGSYFLEQLFNDNLFLISLDDEQQWYRYHQLFAGLLRDRQKATYKDETAELHRRASRWYAQAGMSSAAIKHAIDGADYESAVALIEVHAMDMLMAWHAKTVKAWVHAIPPEWSAQSPKTNLAFAWMHLFSGDFTQAMPYIEQLQGIFSGDQLDADDPSVLAEWLALQATLLHVQGQLEPSMALNNQALAIVPEEDAYVRSLIYGGLAGNYKQMNDYPRAVEAYRRLIEHGRTAGSFVSELMGISALALYAMQRGELHFAYEIAAQGVQRIERSGTLPPIGAAVYGELGGVHYHWYQLDKAHHYLARSAQVSTLSGYSDAEVYHHVIRSRLAQIEGDLERATREIDKAVDLARRDAPAAVREEVIAQQVRIFLAHNRLATAQALLNPHGFSLQTNLSLPDIEPDQFISREFGLLTISALRIFLYQGQNGGIEADLRRGIELAGCLITAARNSQAIPVVLEALLIRVQMFAALADGQASRADVAAALELAKPEGFITIFLEEGEPMARILANLQGDGQLENRQLDYVNKILSAFPAHVQTVVIDARAAATPADSLVEPLSQRELEILRLIGEGFTNKEIAERLAITLHTVKKHSSNIYAKLGVHSRTQAVARARELQLM